MRGDTQGDRWLGVIVCSAVFAGGIYGAIDSLHNAHWIWFFVFVVLVALSGFVLLVSCLGIWHDG